MEPLAERLRPKQLDEYIGQSHLVGEGAILKKAIEAGRIPSFILWGPPGVGKTTLAAIIANTLKIPFQSLSAINSGVKDIREAIDNAKKHKFFDRPSPILFIDEIHRFSKSQQDSLLGAVEKGTITLIGATTENPSFEVISALLSRCQVYVLKGLEKAELIKMLDLALVKDTYLNKKKVKIVEYDAIIQYSGGDGRKLYNILELVTNYSAGFGEQNTNEELLITNELVAERIQQNIIQYDKDGEQHYDIISAFIKSIRGSDPNAAVYWLARMVEGGEDVNFIARRLLILASEDIGLANPNALLIATSCMQAVKMVGWPESNIILSQTTLYLATSAKSNSSVTAIGFAQAEVQKSGNLSVPLPIRNAPTKLMASLDYGKNYKYAHSFEGNFVFQEFLPEELSKRAFYEPSDNPHEQKIKEKLKAMWGEKYGY
ncbi:MAG: replication-associated recombination protein A [Bacteroidota bacterium]